MHNFAKIVVINLQAANKPAHKDNMTETTVLIHAVLKEKAVA